ncbi:hypothetical protein V7S43_009359 [Phytophthora oleae]|uniref:RanBP2-type domain-containing protein n=1 Tax=Phytophthora oleae TaxID=2107226 RepID=A0ABD3FHX5_9STRA
MVTDWSCSRCTFSNKANVQQCAMCMSSRPAVVPAKKTAASPSNGRSAKRSKLKSTPPSQSSLLYTVGSSAEKEKQRLQKKLQQLKELGIELPQDEMMALLQRNCFSVHGAASDYFERMAMKDSQTTVEGDDKAKRRLKRALEKMETVDESFRVLGKTSMQASVNRQGVQLQMGQELLFQAENAGKKRLRPGMASSSTASGIVRIATLQHAQIGRLERNMETLLHPLMKTGLVKLGGVCETPPVSSHTFASFDVAVFVYVSVKAFDVFKDGDVNFHLSEQLYSLLQLLNGVETPSLDALAARSTSEADNSSSQVNPEDLDTLFSECVGANDALSSDADPSKHLVQYLNAIELRDHQKQALRWMLRREDQTRNGTSELESTDPVSFSLIAVVWALVTNYTGLDSDVGRTTLPLQQFLLRQPLREKRVIDSTRASSSLSRWNIGG